MASERGGMMDDLIRRSALIESLHQKKSIMVVEPDGKHSVSLETVIDYIGEYPTVDAVPVVHAEWERIPYSFVGGYRCSCCGQKSLERTFNFCGNCGAKMDGKKVQE